MSVHKWTKISDGRYQFGDTEYEAVKDEHVDGVRWHVLRTGKMLTGSEPSRAFAGYAIEALIAHYPTEYDAERDSLMLWRGENQWTLLLPDGSSRDFRDELELEAYYETLPATSIGLLFDEVSAFGFQSPYSSS